MKFLDETADEIEQTLVFENQINIFRLEIHRTWKTILKILLPHLINHSVVGRAPLSFSILDI